MIRNFLNNVIGVMMLTLMGIMIYIFITVGVKDNPPQENVIVVNSSMIETVLNDNFTFQLAIKEFSKNGYLIEYVSNDTIYLVPVVE